MFFIIILLFILMFCMGVSLNKASKVANRLLFLALLLWFVFLSLSKINLYDLYEVSDSTLFERFLSLGNDSAYAILLACFDKGTDGKSYYDFSPYFSISVSWRPLASMKTQIVDEYGEWKLNP